MTDTAGPLGKVRPARGRLSMPAFATGGGVQRLPGVVLVAQPVALAASLGRVTYASNGSVAAIGIAVGAAGFVAMSEALNHHATQEKTMQTLKPLTALAVALALALAAPGIAAAETAAHDGHAASTLEVMLNDGAKWQGDQNMITGMTAIRGTMTANLDAIHAGSLPADAAKGMAADVQKQLDFMVENCLLEPEVDEQFHIILGVVMTGVAALEAGEVEPGAVKIVQALNAYGEHFEHPGWQMID